MLKINKKPKNKFYVEIITRCYYKTRKDAEDNIKDNIMLDFDQKALVISGQKVEQWFLDNEATHIISIKEIKEVKKGE